MLEVQRTAAAAAVAPVAGGEGCVPGAGKTTKAATAAARVAANARALADAEKARADANLQAAREERASIERE